MNFPSAILLIAMTLPFCTGCATEEDQAVAAIEELGGRFYGPNGDRYNEQHQSLMFYTPQITDAGLGHLKKIKGLICVNLTRTQITDAGLKHLEGLTNLEFLFLDNTQITDAGLEHLKGLTRLKRLSLNNTKITDAGLASLDGLTGLTDLHAAGRQITDTGLQDLKKALPERNRAK